MINPKIFKAYDIRGIYGVDFDESNFSEIIKAIYSLFVKKLGRSDLKISLGHDMRVSSDKLYEVAKQTLLDLGVDVFAIGLSSTPTGYFALFELQTDCHIQITASHNPKEWNGVKFLYRDGDKAMKISKLTGMEDVKNMVVNQSFAPAANKKGQLVELNDVLEKEVKKFLNIVKPVNKRRLKIISDPGNGMGVVYLKELFAQYPVEFVAINNVLDGTFPAHQADPLQFNLYKELQKKVVEEKADLGLMPDGDGDRIYFVDEKGLIIPATMITSLVCDEILKKSPGEKIVVDIRYTGNASNLIKKMGGEVSISPVGHALITKQINDVGAVFAGESSGHFYYKNVGGAESAIQTILLVIKTMQEKGEPLSKILESFHSSFESSEFNYSLGDGVDIKSVIKEIAQKYPDGKISWLDGLSVDYPDWRFNIRSSNTEPLIRLNLEAATKELMEEKLKQAKQLILSFGAKEK